jgi:long-chain acyl-CoA synthetase
MLLYTSGSTGQPKGVMQSFGSITAADQRHPGRQPRARRRGGQDARVLSYLPLAHCFERAWVECCAFVSGRVHVFFSESLATFMADIKRAQPTWFISVPRLWTKFQQAVLAQMPAAQLDAALANPAMAPVVGQKVLAGLGLEHVRRAGSGSAPMPPDLMRWYRRLGLDLYEGYAMTEDFAYSHTGDTGDHSLGTVGRPFPDVQARIADDGEVLVKSPGRMVGYYKEPALNAESFTDDGFFRTGDLGRYDEHGQLVLTGRKKELFKTAKGKYVAPAPIENRLNEHPMVELSLVSGLGQPAAYAVLVLDEFLRPKLGDPAVRATVEAAADPAAARRQRHAGQPRTPADAGGGARALEHGSRHADADDEDQAQPHRSRGGAGGGRLVCVGEGGGVGVSAPLKASCHDVNRPVRLYRSVGICDRSPST